MVNQSQNIENYYDVIVVGAGISGIGAGYYLQKNCPSKSFCILENRKDIGGTWDLFRYPGIRSDSDMFTLGFAFKPWKEQKSIADGPSILNYLNETVEENDLLKKIKFQRKVINASWDSNDSKWSLEVLDSIDNSTVILTCNFLFTGTGYYDYEHGYTPEFDSVDKFSGTLVHPQKWPKDLNYEDKKIIVIGSGATAATIVPVLSKKAKHVTMLQRSPTYYFNAPDEDKFANILKKILPAKLAYTITRLRNVFFQQLLYKVCRKYPEYVKRKLIDQVRGLLPNYDVKKHFTPKYYPWEQRMCLIPNADLFDSIKSKKTSIITDHIEKFTEKGLKLKSNSEIEADIIITATGLNLQQFGGIKLFVDNKPINPADTMTYKSMMFSGVPNFINSFGYINASWTLKADLTCEYACRLINYMDKNRYKHCFPQIPNDVKEERDWLATEFSSGYIHRGIHLFPKQGSRSPWVNTQNYFKDFFGIKFGRINDDSIHFTAQ